MVPSVDVASVRRSLKPGEVEKDFASRNVLQLHPHVVDLALGGHDAGLNSRPAQEFVIACRKIEM